MYIYTYGVSDVCSSLADPTALNYSGLNIAFTLKGSRPWMLKLLVMAVYLIACSHVRISVCFSLNYAVQLPESVRVFSRERTKAQHRRDGEEGEAATEDGAEQSAGEQNRGKGLRTHTCTQNRSSILDDTSAHAGPNIHLFTRSFKESYVTSIRPFATICPRVLFQPWQKPSFTFSPESHGVCLLQYDVSRHVRPQQSRKPVSQGEKESLCCVELLGIPCWVHLY